MSTVEQLEKMRNTAHAAAEYLAMDDQRNALKNLADEVRLSPLTQSVIALAEALEDLRAEVAEGKKCPVCGVVDLGLDADPEPVE